MQVTAEVSSLAPAVALLPRTARVRLSNSSARSATRTWVPGRRSQAG